MILTACKRKKMELLQASDAELGTLIQKENLQQELEQENISFEQFKQLKLEIIDGCFVVDGIQLMAGDEAIKTKNLMSATVK